MSLRPFNGRLSFHLSFVVATSALLVFAGCASSTKEREEARNKVVQNSKLYCEFVNGDDNRDIDVAVNLAMGSKCDPDRAVTMTSYRTPSDINGILYCCGVREPKSETRKATPAAAAPAAPAVAPAPAAPATPAVETKSEVKLEAPKEDRKPNSYKGDPDLDE